jgi:hypothetical protein
MLGGGCSSFLPCNIGLSTGQSQYANLLLRTSKDREEREREKTSKMEVTVF